MSDFDNLDVMIGSENVNPIERELTEAIEESSAPGDIESNMYSRKDPGSRNIERSMTLGK